MTENKSSMDYRQWDQLKLEIFKYLEDRGSIKAELLHKIENYFCSTKSKFRFKKEDLLNCLFNMLENREIHILIPELFKTKWKRKNLSNMKYLDDGVYFCRKFSKFNSKYLNDYKQNDYYFDSRKDHLKNQEYLAKWITHLKLIIKKVKDLNRKIIIFNPIGSNPINIYETEFEGNYNLQSNAYLLPQTNNGNNKLNITLEQQAEVLTIIKAYRKRYMCFYITLIESILRTIENMQKIEDKENKDKNLDNYIRKFAYQCIEFCKSDYIEIIKPNPYRWETFFAKIPIKVLNYDFKSIKFYGRTFETYNELNYCILISKKEREIINKLKNLGYKEFFDEERDNEVAIGLNFEFYFPCSTITHIYFLSKYVWAYHLFLLFYHSFEYIKKKIPEIKFTEKERKLYTLFLPVMESLFDIKDNSPKQKAFFKFRTKDSIELEIIYNEFLIRNVKILEKKLFRWFLIRCNK